MTSLQSDPMIGPTMCTMCSHLDRASTAPDDGGRCTAFPDGIPAVIFTGGFDHREAFPGDRGVRFEPEGPGDAELATEVRSLMTPPS